MKSAGLMFAVSWVGYSQFHTAGTSVFALENHYQCTLLRHKSRLLDQLRVLKVFVASLLRYVSFAGCGGLSLSHY